jgi:hypothetical protein
LSRELLSNTETRDKPDPSLNFKDKALQVALRHLPDAYKNDKFFVEILKNNSHYKQFNIHKGLIWMMNHIEGQVVCVPDRLLKGKSLRGIILDTCHLTLGHAGVNKTLSYVQHWFWWPNIAKDVENFCISCRKCQTSKGSHKKPPGWLHTMPIPAKPWKSIGMDFLGPYPDMTIS